TFVKELQREAFAERDVLDVEHDAHTAATEEAAHEILLAEDLPDLGRGRLGVRTGVLERARCLRRRLVRSVHPLMVRSRASMPRRKSEELGPTETEAVTAAPVVRADR